MQVSGVDALSSASAQQSLLQEMGTTKLSYQVKVEGDSRDAFIEQNSERYRGYVSGIAGLSAVGQSLIAAEINLTAKIVSVYA